MKTIRIGAVSTAIVVFLLCAGCVSKPTFSMTSTEMAVTPAAALQRKTVAIMPVLSLIDAFECVGTLETGLDEFCAHTKPEHLVINRKKAERILAQQPELMAAYEEGLCTLLRPQQNFRTAESDTIHRVNNDAEDGKPGIKYEHLGSPAGSNDGRYKQLDWTIRTKEDIIPTALPTKSLREITTALECDLLLVPVVLNRYRYIKSYQLVFIIPIYGSSSVESSHEVVLFLVSAETGRIERAIQTSPVNKYAVAASVKRLLGRGDYLGELTVD
jgi:hypothetical protein